MDDEVKAFEALLAEGCDADRLIMHAEQCKQRLLLNVIAAQDAHSRILFFKTLVENTQGSDDNGLLAIVFLSLFECGATLKITQEVEKIFYGNPDVDHIGLMCAVSRCPQLPEVIVKHLLSGVSSHDLQLTFTDVKYKMQLFYVNHKCTKEFFASATEFLCFQQFAGLDMEVAQKECTLEELAIAKKCGVVLTCGTIDRVRNAVKKTLYTTGVNDGFLELLEWWNTLEDYLLLTKVIGERSAEGMRIFIQRPVELIFGNNALTITAGRTIFDKLIAGNHETAWIYFASVICEGTATPTHRLFDPDLVALMASVLQSAAYTDIAEFVKFLAYADHVGKFSLVAVVVSAVIGAFGEDLVNFVKHGDRMVRVYSAVLLAHIDKTLQWETDRDTQLYNAAIGMVARGKKVTDILAKSEVVSDCFECGVCYTAFTVNGTEVLAFKCCRHLICDDCGIVWHMRTNTCPYCRKNKFV